jgi:hypothetical protein
MLGNGRSSINTPAALASTMMLRHANALAKCGTWVCGSAHSPSTYFPT